MNIEELKKLIQSKKFVTRGAPFPKKMWRDGYNKALDDILNLVKMEEQESGIPKEADEDLASYGFGGEDNKYFKKND